MLSGSELDISSLQIGDTLVHRYTTPEAHPPLQMVHKSECFTRKAPTSPNGHKSECFTRNRSIAWCLIRISKRSNMASNLLPAECLTSPHLYSYNHICMGPTA